MTGTLVLISGPSGVGKTTLVRRLVARRGFAKSISATTRPPRPGEVHGRNYFFMTVREFRRTELLESAKIYGQYYGTPRQFVETALAAGKNVVLDVDIHCLRAVKRLKLRHVSVFIAPPDFESLKARLLGRATDSAAVQRRRLAQARRELSYRKEYDVVIVNHTLDQAERDIVRFLRRHG